MTGSILHTKSSDMLHLPLTLKQEVGLHLHQSNVLLCNNIILLNGAVRSLITDFCFVQEAVGLYQSTVLLRNNIIYCMVISEIQ